ncbi:MAG: hypothetical protein HY372_00350 [Candidatus Andersenbacteria bacterium]|nr:hypothetical protein [Candidatus Andersenbacteria bacterium]
MENKSLGLWAAVLLLVGGLVHLIPGLYSGLANLTGGFPWIQVVVGILSVIVALVMFAGDKRAGDTVADSSEVADVSSASSSGSQFGGGESPPTI